jgi:site-specific DNA recombinase
MNTGTIYTYRRLSHDDRRSGSCSLEWQQETIQTWLNAHDDRADGDFVDNGVSAAIPLEGRPEGKKLVSQAVHPGDIIVVARLDRMFRDVEDFRSRLRQWVDQGVSLVSCTEQIDFTSPTGRLIATILAAVSEYERELIGQRTRDAFSSRKTRGLRTSSEPRYGWCLVATGNKTRDGKPEYKEEPHPIEQAVIATIVQLWNGCASLGEISAELHRRGLKPRHSKRWAKSTLHDLIRDADLDRLRGVSVANAPATNVSGAMPDAAETDPR